jgi:hypothetical protein
MIKKDHGIGYSIKSHALPKLYLGEKLINVKDVGRVKLSQYIYGPSN